MMKRWKRILKPFNGKTLRYYGATFAAVLSAVGLMAIINGVSIVAFNEGIEVRGDNNRVITPREISEMQPIDVCRRDTEVTVSHQAPGNFYRAEWGKFVLTWTEPLDKMVFTDGINIDYPLAEQNTIACLKNKAKLVKPE